MSPIVLRVRELREALGLTQAELAQRADVRRATVNRIENAHVTAIDLEVLEKLADALGVEPGFLIVRATGGTGSKAKSLQRQRSRR
jgi:transcriptional regulator with XRE-family HTH domain